MANEKELKGQKDEKETKQSLISGENASLSAVEEVEVKVYVGPTLQNVARRNTVYRNGLPKALKEKAESYPILKSLIVDIEEYSDALADIRRRGSLYYIYNEAKKIR